jgi:iron complex outermembrane receptor protein
MCAWSATFRAFTQAHAAGRRTIEFRKQRRRFMPHRIYSILISLLAVSIFQVASWSAPAGSVEGFVHFAGSVKPLPGIEVIIVETNQSAITGNDGGFRIEGVQPGTYTLEGRQTGFETARQRVVVADGAATRIHLDMAIAPLSMNVVVSASPYAQETLKTYQPTGTIESTELAKNLSGTLGDTLKNQPGVNVRSWGPGPSRPVIRGFDGDRVLVIQDGNRAGDLSSQSGDHGVPIDPASLERIEVVRGPASLLYGSNAIGGVVNTVSSDVGHTSPFRGVTGHARLEGGMVNDEVAGNGHIDVGTGTWIFHAGGGGRQTSDYDTPEGEIPNSASRTGNVKAGLDFVKQRGYFGINFGYDDLLYGLPFAGAFEGEEDAVIKVAMKRHNLQFKAGLKEMAGPFRNLRFSSGYTDYKHKELEEDVVNTTFNNQLFEYQVFLDQREAGRLSGTLGIWGLARKYETVGAEALAPPTDQHSFAVFAYEELGWERVKFQFGGRLDHTRYRPEGLPKRNFNGFSGSVGLLAELSSNTVFAANYALAYRAPSIEELYNNGPHVGNLAFEIGNPDLGRELGNGIDLSLRSRRDRIRSEVSFFSTSIRNFIFGAPTGEIEDGLPVLEYGHGDARFTGVEVGLDLGVKEWFWVNLGTDFVRAKLTDTGEHLPRIPPTRGRVGVEFRHKGFSLAPQLFMASRQNRVFSTETVTPGYLTSEIKAAYSWNEGRLRHTFTAGLTNAGNILYRNHLSLIKDRAPEYGRNFKVTYTLDFF